MVKLVRYCWCLFLLISTNAVAQSEDTVYMSEPPVVSDSIVVNESYNSYNNDEFLLIDSVAPISERKVDREELQRMRTDDDYWYANMDLQKRKEKEKPEKPGETKFPKWINVVFWILLIGGFVALLVWLLSTSQISLLRKKSKPVEDVEEEGFENIHELNFEKEIAAAVAAGNYRLGVRLMYLQVLKLMADRNIIQYTAEKTNSDYLFSLLNTKYYKDFFRLTRSFDFIWYGKFPLPRQSFELLQKDFSNFKQQLR